jgi:hypothetical protein
MIIKNKMFSVGRLIYKVIFVIQHYRILRLTKKENNIGRYETKK